MAEFAAKIPLFYVIYDVKMAENEIFVALVSLIGTEWLFSLKIKQGYGGCRDVCLFCATARIEPLALIFVARRL